VLFETGCIDLKTSQCGLHPCAETREKGTCRIHIQY